MAGDERDITTLRGIVIDRLGGVGNLDLPDRKIVRDVVEQYRRNHGGRIGDWQESDVVMRALEEFGFQEVGGPSFVRRVRQVADFLEQEVDARTARQMRRGFLRRHRC